MSQRVELLQGETPAQALERVTKATPKRSKYRNVRTGRYDSKAEANYAHRLTTLKQAGAIVDFLEQVPIRFADGSVYRCDFLVIEKHRVRLVEVKGCWTAMSRAKMKRLRHERPELYETLEVVGAEKV